MVLDALYFCIILELKKEQIFTGDKFTASSSIKYIFLELLFHVFVVNKFHFRTMH